MFKFLEVLKLLQHFLSFEKKGDGNCESLALLDFFHLQITAYYNEITMAAIWRYCFLGYIFKVENQLFLPVLG